MHEYCFREQALKIIQNQLGLVSRIEKVTFDDFNRIFCKGIFKEAMMNVNENFASLNKSGEQEVISLSVKIGEFQRK
jgi:Zn finger protein HypA/HybF involved in hydrogenase expression